MKESASITLYYKDIEEILFNYYCGEYHPKVQKQIEETGKMLCDIETKKYLVRTERHINFILMYKIPIDSLGHSMTEKIDVSLTELCDIINEKISNQGYEIDDIDDNLVYGFGENSAVKLNYLTFHLKKKEKVKTKKKGLKRNV